MNLPIQRAKLSLFSPIVGLFLTIGIISPPTKAQELSESGYILTSIKPIQLIAADITQGVVDVKWLLPAGASPHAYSLRPSEVKAIQQAKALYWVGPRLESFLQKPFSKYPDKTHELMRLTDGESSQTKVLNNKHSSDQDEPESHQHQEHHVDSAHKDSAHKSHDEAHHKPHYVHAYLGEDPHIWLSPIKALQIAALVRDNTSLLYPQYKPQLAANYQRFVEKMQQLDLQLNIEFSSLKGLGFIVFHDAYARFIEYYQLNQVAALTINPAKRPGAKHLADIRNIIQQSHPVCVFSEPQFSKVAVESLIRNFSINVGELDPLATNVKVTQDRYISFIQGFARQFIDCLSRP